MKLQHRYWYNLLILILILGMISTIMACDDDDDEETTPPVTTTDQTTPPVTTTPAPTASNEPIKIGVIIDFTGPAAMAGFLADGVFQFAEWYWNEKQGGIQIGDTRRPVEFVKYDNAGQVAQASAAAKKAIIDGVSAVTMGGISNQYAYPIADETDSEKILYSTFLTDPPIFDDYNWTVGSFFNQEGRVGLCAEMVVEQLKPRTIGVFAHELAVDVALMKDVIVAIQALDPEVEVVYEDYHQLDMTDLSSYMTKIRFENPDVLITLLTEANYNKMATQMLEVGGWRDIQHIALTEAGNFNGIKDAPGAEGWIIGISYMPDFPLSPAAAAFTEAWAEKCEEDSDWCKKFSPGGSQPLSNHPVMYNPLLTAIKAIELAGSDDPAKIAEAARSGNLAFDSPLGQLQIGTDGKSNLPGFYLQINDGVYTAVAGYNPVQ